MRFRPLNAGGVVAARKPTSPVAARQLPPHTSGMHPIEAGPSLADLVERAIENELHAATECEPRLRLGMLLQ